MAENLKYVTQYTGSDKTVSVQEFVALRTSDDITYYNYSILEYLNGFDMFIISLLYDYEDEFNDLAVTVKFSGSEKNKYKYKPYLLALDVYGSTEAEFIIKMMNGIIDPKEFDFDQIKLIRYSDLRSILSRIQAANEEFMSNNRSKLKATFKESDGNNIW